MFQPGKPKTGGRKPGVRNKKTRNYLDLQAFAKLIWEGAEIANLSGKEMIELGFRGLNILLPKIQNLPGTPADSLKNAEQAAEVLKTLEDVSMKNENVNP